MLNRLLIVLLLGISAITLRAQEAVSSAVTEAVAELERFYQLTPEQSAEMETILSREARNVAEIAALRTSAPTEYLERLRAIRKSTQAATRRTLNEEQRRLFQAARQRERATWNEAYKELQSQGLSATEIELQLTEQYLEAKGW